MRVYELAKELGKSSKELLAALQGLGIEIKNHMSAVTDEQEARVREALAGEQAPPAVPAAPTAAAPPPAASGAARRCPPGQSLERVVSGEQELVKRTSRLPD